MRTGNSTDCILEESETGVESRVVCREDEGAHDNVGMTVDIFGEGMHHDVGAEEERRGIERREEGIVH